MERKFETLIGVQCYNGAARAGQLKPRLSHAAGLQDREAL
jgi:hypothetical protein